MTITINQPESRDEVFFDDEYFEEDVIKYGYYHSDGSPILDTLIPTPPISFTSSIDEDVNDYHDKKYVFHFTSLVDGSRIPFDLVSKSSSWSEAFNIVKNMNKEEKKNEKMTSFNEFNKLTDKIVADEINRRFMATLPTMSKAMKARVAKETEDELARKAHASDQFYNKGRPGATSHTAWGHKTGGKNKKGLLEKSIELIASERKVRRLATKAKSDAEEVIRTENFRRIAEIKERLALEEKACQPVIEPEPETEIQIFKRLEIESCVEKIKNRVELIEEEIVVETNKPSVKWQMVQSKHTDKMSKMASSIQQSLFSTGKIVNKVVMCKSVMNGYKCRYGDKCLFTHSVNDVSIATGKMGDKGTKMCKSALGGFKCKYGDKCQFAHSSNELVLVPCRFGQSCKNCNNCMFLHPTETKEIYCKRIGIKSTLVPDVGTSFPTLVKPIPIVPRIFKIDKKDIKTTIKYILDNKLEKVQIVFN